ncbi:MAG: metal ABC transporter permease [Bacilli bacterium]|nr:metal ABC transporter permease [Bacilli bacterium]
MLHYEFMRIAFVVGILLAISIPLVGSTAVFKRLSSSGDALAHSSLAGVAIGLAAGLNPLLISVIACVVAFLIIEIIRKRFSKYSELGVAVVLSLSVGLAGILMNYTKTGNIESYLFGSILLVNSFELYLAIGMTVLVVLFYLLFHSQIFAYIYNESEAKVQGVKVGIVNSVQSLLLSLVIAISAKTIGSLVVSSLIAIPVAAALQLKLGYKWTLLCSIGVSLISVIAGITIAYYADFTPGATIALVAVACLFALIIYRVLRDFFVSLARNKK